ncbi:hypothetical protein DBV15_07208 [Temnothorax longispinosus]|uniref:Uncharacterized protein n=1 Tax=Temnothorax longispinosus TaxID=300112 RepID=A0A4S2JAF0_9HYME|nr:hypothetical protein DBV15_07208 [Temnothorax longispinosus]
MCGPTLPMNYERECKCIRRPSPTPGNTEALSGRSPWSFIRRFIARVLGAFHTNPLTGTNFGAYDSEATACRMSASVQSPVELPSVDARSSAPPTRGKHRGPRWSPPLAPLQTRASIRTRAHELSNVDHGYLHKSGCSRGFIRGNLLPEGDGKERHKRELLTRSVRPYTKCTISPCSVTKNKKKREKEN